MSQLPIDAARRQASRAPDSASEEDWETMDPWRQRARVVLSPIAAPSVLGLFGFSAATLIVAANLAGWYGGSKTPLYLFPFVAIFGGIAQFLAGMWAYKARDVLATAMHGMWGSFWIAYGILFAFVAAGALTVPTGSHFPALGFWFIMLAAITWAGMLASFADGLGLTLTLGALAGGSSLLAAGYLTGTHWLITDGGWVLVGSAGAAFYTATAMLLESSYGRVILPLFKPTSKASAIPGGKVTEPIEFRRGQPGVKTGQ